MTTLKFENGALGYVGSSWTTAGIYSIRVFGQKGVMHYEVDFCNWDTPDKLHETSLLCIQRGKDGYDKREVLEIPQGDMFCDELDLLKDACVSGNLPELTAHDGNVALAVVNAALKSIENNGAGVKILDVMAAARN
jgi:predicted dehydrogenase